MKLSEIKHHLANLETISFQLPDGSLVPNHFHVTEVGQITKNFIDCGGTIRKEEVVNFQLWEANDYDHRLHPEKLVHIIELSEKVLGLGDHEIEVEYQGDTIGKYSLEFNGTSFVLTSTNTACLALDACNVPEQETATASSCAPGSGCC
ncbi:MAG: hypothetical protein JXR05_13905 [Flavobacteriaceae bacterium]